MPDEGYKKRLSDWIAQEVQAAGSYAKLAVKIAIASESDLSGEALRTWYKGGIGEEGLRNKSIEQIARYRKMTPEAVRAWLEGREVGDPPNPKQDEALQFVRTAALSDVVAVLRVGLERVLQSVQEEGEMSQQTPIAAFIQCFMQRENVIDTPRTKVTGILEQPKTGLSKAKSMRPY